MIPPRLSLGRYKTSFQLEAGSGNPASWSRITSWRWRLLYLRALIDAELHRTEGRYEGDVLQQAFDELRDIYQFKEKPRYVGVPMQKW